jgi:hypothetical protein
MAAFGTEVDLDGLDHVESCVGPDREIDVETPDLPSPDRNRRTDENEENEDRDRSFHDRVSIERAATSVRVGPPTYGRWLRTSISRRS